MVGAPEAATPSQMTWAAHVRQRHPEVTEHDLRLAARDVVRTRTLHAFQHDEYQRHLRPLA
jgi:uncharacterized protein with GYD domain